MRRWIIYRQRILCAYHLQLRGSCFYYREMFTLYMIPDFQKERADTTNMMNTVHKTHLKRKTYMYIKLFNFPPDLMSIISDTAWNVISLKP
jgi:hypothetical protein